MKEIPSVYMETVFTIYYISTLHDKIQENIV